MIKWAAAAYIPIYPQPRAIRKPRELRAAILGLV
jgi:hypothetical protein